MSELSPQFPVYRFFNRNLECADFLVDLRADFIAKLNAHSAVARYKVSYLAHIYLLSDKRSPRLPVLPFFEKPKTASDPTSQLQKRPADLLP